MSRLLVLTKKNLLRFVKNPKTIGFLVTIPIIYYLILGLIFGGISFNDTTASYNVGWVDNDSTIASQQNYQLDYINQIIDDSISGINLINFSTTQEAEAAAEDGIISSYVFFPEGFEDNLELKSKENMVFFSNDTTTSLNYSVDTFLLQFRSSYSQVIEVTNVSKSVGNQIFDNFNNYSYDCMLIVNDGFLKGLENNWNVNLTYKYRNSTNTEKTEDHIQYIIGLISPFISNYEFYPSNSNIILLNESIANSIPFEPLEYEIYFLGEVSPATKATILNTINQAIQGIINYNPGEIELNVNEESISGKLINNITFSAPGYLLYGPMSILSFVLVVLTGEKKDGIFKRLSSTQVKNWEIILANIISSILLIFMQFAIGATILAIFGWDPIFASLFDLIFGVFITMLLFSLFLLSLGFALAPVFKDPDSAGGGVWIIIIPLSMLSGIFVPIELFGDAMKSIATFLPPRFGVVALQNILLNGNSIFHPEVLLNWGLLLGSSIVIFAIGIKLFNKFVRSS